MELEIERIAKRKEYTIGRLYIDGRYICDTLEDTVRPPGEKVYGKTAIPEGTYAVTMNVVSPHFAGREAYDWCEGRLPRLLNVPGFSGILIHAGNTAEDTKGCILVGENKVRGKVLHSMATLKKLWNELEEANRRRQSIFVNIK